MSESANLRYAPVSQIIQILTKAQRGEDRSQESEFRSQKPLHATRRGAACCAGGREVKECWRQEKKKAHKFAHQVVGAQGRARKRRRASGVGAVPVAGACNSL